MDLLQKHRIQTTQIPLPKRSVRQGTQIEFNKVRSELNTLLAHDMLTDDDITMIRKKIKEFDTLNPGRWPQPRNYEHLLNTRILKNLLDTLKIALDNLSAALV